MKKIIFSMLAAMMTLTAMAQSDVWYWKDGAATKVEAVDSITFEAPVVPTDTHEYVDLGLSVKWATCNVGATSPEDYGDYFAWGETTAKENYSWDTYTMTADGGNTFTKYNDSDGKTVLDAEDDAAAVNWGGAWRMPTLDEMKELLNPDNCSWKWTTVNEVNGYKVTSKKEGYTDKSLFLPAAGCRYGSSLRYAGSLGLYWSATRYEDYPGGAYYLYFDSGRRDWDYNDRYYGFSVRPVCP